MKHTFTLCCSLLILGCSREGIRTPHQTGSDTTVAAGQPSRDMLTPMLTYEQRQGREIYLRYCSVCHGERGGADGFNTYNLDPKPHTLADSAYVAAISDAALTQVIGFGGRGVNRSVLMPGYQWTLNRDRISYVVSFVRVLARNAEIKQ
jgi:mono/diheme cytochrome c family protein